MTTRHPWELHAGSHVRWGGTVLTVLHDAELSRDAYHVPARRADDGHQVDAEMPLNAEVELADQPAPELDRPGWSWIHIVGDLDCKGCWSGFPVPCTEEGCGGLVHAEFEDESWDSYWLSYGCDRCGSTDRPPREY